MDYRWDGPYKYSITYALFKKHHAHLNDMYWAYLYGVATLGRDATAAKTAKKDPLGYLVNLKDPHYNTISSWDSWITGYESFEKLNRINLLLDLNAYFEVYYRNILCLALESRPDVLIGRPCVADGLVLLKGETKYHYVANDYEKYTYAKQLTDLTKGTWPDRLNSFSKLFGGVPAVVKAATSDLEEIRKLRNGAGHFFGRDNTAVDGRVEIEVQPMTAIKDKRLQKYLGVIAKCAKDFDQFLFHNFIGSFEFIVFCLQKGFIAPDKTVGESVRSAAKLLGTHGYILKHGYMREAIRYYNQI